MNPVTLAYLSIMLLLSSLAPPAPAEPVTVNGPLIVAQLQVLTLDPQKTTAIPSQRAMRQIYETLVELDAEGNLQPGLATSWQRIDSLTWEFRIRPNVKFHNGDTLTAKDVKFSLDRLINPFNRAPGAFVLEAVDSVTLKGDEAVLIRTREAFAPLPYHLAHGVTAIMSERAARAAGADFEWQPVGTGPYKLHALGRPWTIELTRFDGYWGSKAAVERIRFVLADNAQQLNALVTDPAVDLAFSYEPVAASFTHLQTLRTPSLSVEYLGFNTQRPPFNKVEVRQAVSAALDLSGLVERYTIGQAAIGPLSPATVGAHTELPQPTRDLEKARQLLRQAGLEQGFSTTLLVNSAGARPKVAELIQEQLGEVGIKVNVEVVEFNTLLQQTAAGRHEMFLLNWLNITADPDYGLYPTYHSTHGAGNLTFYTNSKVDKLLELGRSAMDPAARWPAYREAQELIMADVPAVYTVTVEEVIGVRPGLKGFVPHATGRHLLSQIHR